MMAELAFPIILGLDFFLSQMGVRLHVGEHSYELCINGRMTVFTFLCQPLGKNQGASRRKRLSMCLWLCPQSLE